MKSTKEVIVKVEPVELTAEEKQAKCEIMRISRILENMRHRAEVGCCVRIHAEKLLEPEHFERMKTPYIYGIITNTED